MLSSARGEARGLVRRLDAVAIPPFVPPRWLASPHLQSVLAAFAPVPRHGPVERVQVPVDGGMLAGRLHLAPGHAAAAVLLLHGITGTAGEPLVARLACKLAAHGIPALALSMRGAGESLGCVPGIFHSGLTEDVRCALAWLARRYPRVVMGGLSLGGQLALRTAGEWGASPPRELVGVVAISPPLDLACSSTYFDRPAAAPYRWYVMARLHARYLRARPTLPPEFTLRRGLSTRGLHAYNASVVAPLFGYRDLDDYYARTSCDRTLAALGVPAVVIHAEDDPVVPVEPARQAQSRFHSVRVVLTGRGGHAGFYAASPAPGDADRFWAENRAVDFTRAMLRED